MVESHTSGLGQPSLWTDRERRLWIMVLFCGSILIYAGRGALPVSIVEMSTELSWDKQISGIILSSFFWGYILTQIVGGQLADRHGGELILWMATLSWSTAVFSICILANVSMYLILMVNLINGLSQGVYFPAIANVMSKRLSSEKRSFFYGLILSGPQFGSAVCGLLGYLFIFHDGWEYMFFIIGILGFIWGLLIRWLSKRHQLRYQLLDPNTESSTNINVKVDKKESVSCVQVPWRDLLRQPPIIALLFSSFCEGFFCHCLMAWAPTFFHDTFPNHIHQTYTYNIIPWIAKGVSSALGGYISNKLIQNGVSITVTRKIMEGVSLLGITFCLFLLSLYGVDSDNFYFALSMIVLAFFCHGFEVAGSSITSIDLTPSYSGLMFGIMNTISAIPGIFGVSLIGHILHSTNNWSLVFQLISFICFSGFIVFTTFGSAKRLVHIDNE